MAQKVTNEQEDLITESPAPVKNTSFSKPVKKLEKLQNRCSCYQQNYYVKLGTADKRKPNVH